MAASHHDAKQWAASLGVHVSDARLAANPGLARLLDELAAMHDPSTGLSRATAARLASAQAAEHEARSAALGAEWLLERIRACAERRLRELLRERQRRVGQEQPSPLERAWQRIRAALIAGTAASSADAASLGLDAEHILAAQPAMSEIGSGGAPAEKETRACVADIEAECAKWLSELRQQAGLANGDDAAAPLSTLVERELAQLSARQTSIRAHRAEAARLQRAQLEALEEQRAVLAGVLRDFKLGVGAADQAEHAEWLRERCATLRLKTATVKHAVLADTYKPDTVRALQRVRRHLQQAHEAARAELESLRVRAAAYDSVGLGLPPLAAEYAALRAEIENKEWALRQLQEAQ